MCMLFFFLRNCLFNHVMALCVLFAPLYVLEVIAWALQRNSLLSLYRSVFFSNPLVCIYLYLWEMANRFQSSAPGMLVNPTVMSKLNTNLVLSSRKTVGSQKISVDNNRGKWGARVTVPLQLEGNSALLALRQSLRVYRPKVEGRQILQEELIPLKETPQLLSHLSLCYMTQSKLSVFVLPARFMKDHFNYLRWRYKVLPGLIILPITMFLLTSKKKLIMSYQYFTVFSWNCKVVPNTDQQTTTILNRFNYRIGPILFTFCGVQDLDFVQNWRRLVWNRWKWMFLDKKTHHIVV